MHIRKNEWEAFENNTMTTEEMISFLEHLDHCNYCLDEMAANLHSNAPAPPYLREQILQKAASPEIQTAKAATSTSCKMQMFYYSLRTVAGVIGALLILFGVCRLQLKPVESAALYTFSSEIQKDFSYGSRKITDYLNEFSNIIVNGGNEI